MYILSKYFLVNKLNIVLGINGIVITLLSMLAAGKQIKKKLKSYYFLNIVFITSFLAVIFTKNWLVFIVFWEMVTVSVALMILWENKKLASQYLIVQFLGSSLLICFSLITYYHGYQQIMPVNEMWLQNLLVIGLGMKSAIFGLHFWLPVVHSKAPAPVSAILSAWVVKLGFITYLKIITEGNFFLLGLGMIMIFYGGFKAFRAVDYKLLLAYSSVSQLGYVAVGIGSGSKIGVIGAVLHIIVHSVVKGGLFLGSGYLIEDYKSRSLYDFKNIWKRQRVNAVLIITAFASLMGLPFMAGYNSKHLIREALNTGYVMPVLLLLAGIVSMLYSLRLLYNFFLSSNNVGQKVLHENKDFSYRTIDYLLMATVIVLLLILGFSPGLIINNIDMFMDFDLNIISYDYIHGLLEMGFALMLALFIFKFISKYNLNVDKDTTLPSMDPLFSKVNKNLHGAGRFLYRILYRDFQYQLLWIPLFLLMLLTWALFAG